MQDECMLKVTEKITEKSSKLLDIRFKEQFFFSFNSDQSCLNTSSCLAV